MFSRYPKVRPPLPDAYARIHQTQYKENRRAATPAASLSRRMEAWLHKRVAADVLGDRTPRTTLEIGAGTLNHLPFEPEIGPYDIVEPFRDLYEGSPLLSRIRTIYVDITDVPDSQRYDRITSIATFEHICNLPEVVARAALLLSPGGVLRISIPSEGTLLWTLGWKLTTGIEFRLRHGLDYGRFLEYEHVNTAREIEEVLRHFFTEVRGAALGLGKALSFYQFFSCARPDAARCHSYLASLPGLASAR